MSIEQDFSFDHEFTLQELWTGVNTEKLLQALSISLDSPVRILNINNTSLFTSDFSDYEANQTAIKTPIYGELEAIGYIEAHTCQEKLQSAAQLVQLILYSNSRYLMASDLHIQTQKDDFEELQRRHASLVISQENYKNLAESLDLQVKQQVKTIENAQIKLYENEKLASVGRLAAGVAHEINNPIGFIRSNLSSAQSYLDSFIKLNNAFNADASISYLRQLWKEENLGYLQEDMSDILKESIDGVDRVAAIVKDLAVENADINEIIRQTCHICSPQLKDKLQIILDLANIPHIFCNPAELGQVFLNLILNAADAVSEKGKVRFKTEVREPNLCIEVRDTGCGISESDLSHVFEPFFTTKEVGLGIGLGLTVCLNIVKAHQGSLTIISKQEKGTLVTILLPIKHEKE